MMMMIGGCAFEGDISRCALIMVRVRGVCMSTVAGVVVCVGKSSCSWCWSNACKELGIRKGGIRIKPMEERL